MKIKEYPLITALQDADYLLLQNASGAYKSIKASDAIAGYKIIISSSTGSKLFEEKKITNSPPTYEVACGENCPPGHVRCETTSYPGYCCIPCKATADKINQIANKIR